MEHPNNIQLTYIVVASDGSQYIQKSEYDKVKQENYELHTKIFNLTANQQTLHDTIKNRDEIILARDKTIEELQKENNILKIRIKELEDKISKLELDNKSLNTKIDILEKENKEIKEDNRTIKEDNKEIHKQLTKMMNKSIFNKYTKAIQDVNRLEQFEKQLNNPKYMIQLREDRVDEYHYINDNDTTDEQKKKMNILYEKINNMTNEIKNMFNRRYPNLINNISSMIPYDNTVIMTQIEKDDINEWWEE
jgi:chromosome segregation ATPase